MKTKTVIKNLNKKFPNINAVDYSEWDNGEEGQGIWLRNGDEHLEMTPWGNLESMEGEVYDYLNSVGWFLEPQDSMTMMAWEA
jgi:hypothetical protein